MSAREVMREALCLSFYGTDWAKTSDFRRSICDDMARDGLAALSAAGLAVLPVENNDTIRRAVWLAQYQRRNVVANHGVSDDGIAALVEAKIADPEQRENDMVAWRAVLVDLDKLAQGSER